MSEMRFGRDVLLNIVNLLRAHQSQSHLGAAALVGAVGPSYEVIDTGAYLRLPVTDALHVLPRLRRPHDEHIHHCAAIAAIPIALVRLLGLVLAAFRPDRFAERQCRRPVHLPKHMDAIPQGNDLVDGTGGPHGSHHHLAVRRERHRTAGRTDHAPRQRMAGKRAPAAFRHDLDLEVVRHVERNAHGTAQGDRVDGLEKALPVYPHQMVFAARRRLFRQPRRVRTPRTLRGNRGRKARRLRLVQRNEQRLRAPTGGGERGQRDACDAVPQRARELGPTRIAIGNTHEASSTYCSQTT